MAAFGVTFQPSGATVNVEPADFPCGDTGEPGSILDIALTHGVGIEHACGGTGICGRCRVRIDQGAENLSEADDDELDMLDANDAGPADRLACRAIVKGPVTLTIPEE